MITRLNQAFINLTSHPDFGKLLLRLTFGVLMLFHGVAKVQHGVGWISGMLAAKGLPGFIAYGVFIGEIITPVLIIIGLFTRQAAFIYAFNILVATLLVGMGKFFTLTDVGAWGLESEALYFLGGLSIMFLGAGKYALSADKEKEWR
ncbi:DoxX family protein [Kosakonia sp. ML.JS2a]|uniref:DoxX family protein n=1 Tax=Kosakonia sp. ML.JS2a TaxID=2980557 RepID=UPI0021D9F37C|nr:DoxX family protein [Kosakonia sp. ML.JS2a]UXY10428.1 DoxX family protein [Kosakonia sp. ML.JS2a]